MDMEMIERAYRIFDLMPVSEWLSYLMMGYCMQYYYGSFLESRFGKGGKGKDRISGWLVIAVLLLSKVFRTVVGVSGFQTDMGILLKVLYYGLVYLPGIAFYRIHRWKTIFVLLSFTTIEGLAGLLVNMENFLDIELREVLGDWLVTEKISLIAYAWMLVALSMGQELFRMAVLLCLLRCMVKSFRNKEIELCGREVLQLLIPCLVGMCLYELLRIMLYGREETFLEVFADPVLCIVVSILLGISLLAIFYGVKTFQDVHALNRERKERSVLEKQVSALQEYVGERERIWSGVRSIKHDMRNTLSVAMRMAEQEGGGERLQAYLGQLNLSLEAFEPEFRTGNAVADALLDMKCHEARKQIPDLQVDVDELVFPEALVILDYDIGVILGNALDNAVEACVRLREKSPEAECHISLSSFLDGQMFLLEIKNSFDEETLIWRGDSPEKRASAREKEIPEKKVSAGEKEIPQKREISGKKEISWKRAVSGKGEEFPETEKIDGEAHGIGLPNIKNTCEKYHGAVEWSVWEGVFTLSVMLQNVDLQN